MTGSRTYLEVVLAIVSGRVIAIVKVYRRRCRKFIDLAVRGFRSSLLVISISFEPHFPLWSWVVGVGGEWVGKTCFTELL